MAFPHNLDWPGESEEGHSLTEGKIDRHSSSVPVVKYPYTVSFASVTSKHEFFLVSDNS